MQIGGYCCRSLGRPSLDVTPSARLRCNSSKGHRPGAQQPSRLLTGASGLTSPVATPVPALFLANPQDVKDPDQLRILIEVEAQDAAARPEHDLTEPRVISWRPHHRIPGLSG